MQYFDSVKQNEMRENELELIWYLLNRIEIATAHKRGMVYKED
jgi:hypothetical protein